nr:MAG TPA: Replication initiation and membrane attachment [Caudoviricetes sp.]
MAEYNKQRYYWIKISDTFMNSDTIDFLMSKKDGANYVVLYQMLCLKTVNNNGQLAQNLGEILIPYDTEKIQRETKWFSADTIRVAMDLYQKIGLIYEQKNGVLKIADFENLIASQTISAEKKKTYRAKIAQNKIENDRLQLGGTKGGQMSTDIDIEIDKEIEIEKDININNNIEGVYRKGVVGGKPQSPPTTNYTFDDFVKDNPKIIIDKNPGPIIQIMDFKKINERIQESNLLKQIENLSFFTKHYREVVAGKYKDLKFRADEKEQHFDNERNNTEFNDLLSDIDNLKF